jgi:hypothetical protein
MAGCGQQRRQVAGADVLGERGGDVVLYLDTELIG